MNTHLINNQLLQDFDLQDFHQNQPFPWFNFDRFLSPDAFTQLCATFPSIELFEKHNGLSRIYGQRPHNRYYLAYEHSIYQPKSDTAQQGIIYHKDLPDVWQQFIEELETSQPYRAFIQAALGITDYQVRYAWHLGHDQSEVSPHRDAEQKAGTQIFYFNTDDDWDMAWGGSICALGDKLTAAQNPDFDDFALNKANSITNNRCFLFKNTENAWHGVKALSCPPGAYRKLFNVIFEFPHTPKEKNQSAGLFGLGRGINVVKKILQNQ